MRQLTSLDAQFLAIEDDRTVGHINALAIVDAITADGRTVDAALAREVIGERIHLLPPLRWRLHRVPFSLDHAYWFDTVQVDLDHHIIDTSMPRLGGEEQFAAVVAALSSQPLDRSRPLWRLRVIHGRADGSVALLLSLHHAAVDGESGAEIISALFDTSPQAPSARTPECSPMMKAIPPRPSGVTRRTLINVATRPLQAVRSAPSVLPHIDRVVTVRGMPGTGLVARTARMLLRADAVSTRLAPTTRFQRRLSGQRQVGFAAIALHDLAALRAPGYSVNDIVMAAAAGALRNCLARYDELPDEPLIALVPRSLRRPQDHGTFGNKVGLMYVDLPTHEPRPSTRLRLVAARMQAAKQDQSGVPDTIFDDVNGLVPPALFATAARLATRIGQLPGIAHAANVAVSNVPGSPVPLYFGGATVRSTYPVSTVMDGIGLNLTVTSYNGSLTLGVVADASQGIDAQQLADDFVHEIGFLVEANLWITQSSG